MAFLRRRYTLRLELEKKEVKVLLPGDTLHLTMEAEASMPMLAVKAEVMRQFEWDGRTLRLVR